MSLDSSGTTEQSVGEEIQVLEFKLNDQRYCVRIDQIAEIVDADEVTTIPDSEPHVVGVMNLRDETTTIIDPKIVFQLDQVGEQRRVIILDGTTDDQYGWIVDAVDQVTTIQTNAIEEETDSAVIRGLVNRDDGFLILVDPEAIND